jgi:hypothetical protein
MTNDPIRGCRLVSFVARQGWLSEAGLVTLCSLTVARHNKKSEILCGLLLRSVTSQQPVSYAFCAVFRYPLVLGAIELVVSFLCSLLVYGHDKLQFGTFGFCEPKILIHVAFLFNRSFLCVEAVEDDALPIRRRNILSNSKQPGISRANILCTMFYLSFLIVDVAETVCTRFHFWQPSVWKFCPPPRRVQPWGSLKFFESSCPQTLWKCKQELTSHRCRVELHCI